MCPIKQPSLHHSIFPFNYDRERTGDLSHSFAKGPGQTMCSVMNALTSGQLSMAQYVAVFMCESKYRFDKQTLHPFTTWELFLGSLCSSALGNKHHLVTIIEPLMYVPDYVPD